MLNQRIISAPTDFKSRLLESFPKQRCWYKNSQVWFCRNRCIDFFLQCSYYSSFQKVLLLNKFIASFQLFPSHLIVEVNYASLKVYVSVEFLKSPNLLRRLQFHCAFLPFPKLLQPQNHHNFLHMIFWISVVGCNLSLSSCCDHRQGKLPLYVNQIKLNLFPSQLMDNRGF